MSAQDNLSKELFFTAHRGITVATDRDIDQKHRVGMHWSAEKHIAREFAVDNTDPDYQKPHVIHGIIPISSVETDTGTLEANKVGGVFHLEKEIPVKQRQKILITGRTTYRGETRGPGKYQKSRTRTYNPPREAQA